MGASLRDVAARAGVSVKTVSNVVNSHPHVSEKMRTHVQLMLDEMGYQPNLHARRLRSGRSGIIALALPSLGVPYFAELAGAVFRAAEGHGIQVLIEQTGGEREREKDALTGLRTGLIDGVLLSPLSLRSADLESSPQHIPTVLLGEQLSGVSADHVAVDNVAAAREATEHLITLGRRRIALVGAQDESTRGMVSLRIRGWQEALSAAGLWAQPHWQQPTKGFGRYDGFLAVNEMLDAGRHPDGVFCVNDLLAVGALRALALRGVRVPEDVAVCGFDDSEEGWYATPSLTSVSPDKEAIAELGVQRLLERIAGVARDVAEIEVGHRLVIRESTIGPT